jgi:DNA polymerase-3 subunit delta
MKLDARQAAAFLRNVGAARLVLLHGDDEGLLRERAQVLTRQVAGTTNDPFLVVELTRDGWGRIPAEMATLSMIGGRRVVVVRDATDAVLPPVAAAMKGPGQALLILEAAGLGRGKLRSFAEGTADAAAIACYAEEGLALAGLITRLLAESQVTADADAVAWLSQTLGGDRGLVRGEVEKLVLFAGSGGRLDLDMVQACIGEGAAAAGDDGLLAASLGEVARCDAFIEASLTSGLAGIALLRMALGHLQKLHQATLRMQGGMSAAEAIRAMRPPVFYKATSAMTAALALWTTESLTRVIGEARLVELACKQTGSRPELLARRFVQTIARTAKAQRSRIG